MTVARWSLLGLSLVTPLLVSAQPGSAFRAGPPWFANDHGNGHYHPGVVSGTLVDKVRKATERFKDINVAIGEGWVQGSPCVSGPNEGAMGVHYVQPTRIGDGILNAEEPEALIYEPMPGGRVRLVGVEFIAIADVWNEMHPDSPAALEGHLLQLNGAPNRYRLPAFYELHVWAWQQNPNGTFADWNTLVTCELQPGD
jgi:hypothetical protein